MAYTSRLSLLEKILFAFRVVFLTPWQLLFNILRTLANARKRGLPAWPYIACGAVNIFLETLTPRQIQYCSPSTRTTYETWIQRKVKAAQKANELEVLRRLKRDVEPLDDGKSALLWLGDRRKAKKAVLFFHGGAYISPLIPGHVEWCWQYVNVGIETGVETAVAVLEYTLAPEGRYPMQLSQAVNGLSHMLSAGFRPRDIVIGGDSAGGNLAAALLFHLVQPKPTVDPIKLEEPLYAAFLVSPWVTDRTNDASFKENRRVDMISASIVTKATSNFGLASAAFPLGMDSSYFRRLSTAVTQMYVTAGNHEVLRDQVVAYIDKIRSHSPGVEIRFDLQPTAAHDFILLEGQRERIGEYTKAMRSWMKALLSTNNGQ